MLDERNAELQGNLKRVQAELDLIKKVGYDTHIAITVALDKIIELSAVSKDDAITVKDALKTIKYNAYYFKGLIK